VALRSGPRPGTAAADIPSSKVSVVIPALNEEAGITVSIHSALEAGADEIIVVDGGSRDGTVAVARGLGVRVLFSPPGRARQMNAGAAAATGEILLFLHADTRLPSGAAAAVRTACGRNGALGGAFAVRLDLSPGASLYRRAILGLTGRMVAVRARLFLAYTGDQAIFLRREVFERLGGYPDIPLMEDAALSRRLARTGKTILVPLPLTTSARRWEARGPLRTILLMWSLRLAYLFLGMSPETCARLYGVIPRSGAAA
jgi:rSAM/selenodomain-associated transferase 2